MTAHPGGTFSKVPKPVVTGSTVRGGLLRAAYAASTPAADHSDVRWYVGGVLALDAYGDPVLGSTFRTRVGDQGRSVVAEVAVYRAGVRRTVARSASYGPVLVQLVGTIPKVMGAAEVGKKLTARVAGWTAGTSFRYQWLAGGKPITGATRATYRLTAAQLGKTVQVRVTGTRSTYTTLVKTSRKTGKVKR